MRRLLPFILVLLLVAALFRIDFYFTLLYLILAVTLLAKLWSERALAQLIVRRRYTDRAFVGEKVTVELRLENRGWLPVPWIEINEAIPVQLRTPPFYHVVISMRPREQRTLEYEIGCQQRGYYRLGDMHLTGGDLFGIAEPTHRIAPSAPFLVYPKVLPIEALGLPSRAPQPVLLATTPLFDDPARVRGVRNYLRGDSPRRIHWRATAHKGELLVKQFQPGIARETMLCLDLDEASYERGLRYSATELAITVVASLATHIISRDNLPVGLTTRARFPDAGAQTITLPPRSEQSHLLLMLEILAQVETVDEGDFIQRLHRESAHLAWGSTIVIVTGRATESLLALLETLRRGGYAPALIIVGHATLSDALKQRTTQMNVPTHRVWDEQDVSHL